MDWGMDMILSIFEVPMIPLHFLLSKFLPPCFSIHAERRHDGNELDFINR